jgi:Kef-type K+ transport system membrane component KefB
MIYLDNAELWVRDSPSREGLVVGLGMNGRGTVEIIIASIGLSAGIIDQQLFSILMFIAIFTTSLVPVTVKWEINWLDAAGELVYTRNDSPTDPTEPETVGND